MQEALALLVDLDPADADLLLSAGTERAVQREDVLIREGTDPESLMVVLEGLLEARLEAAGGRPVARLGPGELLGEVSWLEGRPASVSVRAIEDGVVLSVERRRLEELVQGDARFAARLYRALGRSLARRLRARTDELGRDEPERERDGGAATGAWERLEPVIEGLKDLMLEAEEATRKAGGEPPARYRAATHEGLEGLCRALTRELGDDSPLEPSVRDELGARVRRELHPYLMLTRIVERIYTKPRGYAGDFLTIEWMYANDPGGTGAAGPLIDTAFLERPAARAVRNRRGLLAGEIARAVERGGRVTSLACGPARELFDVFAGLEDPARLKATCLDIDLQALALVSDHRDRVGLKRHMQLEQGNLVYLATGRSRLDLPPQDLVYSIGLIDYFQDRFVVALLDWIHERLAPGGKVVLGNFHPRNPDRALMDHVLDWRLVHRTEEDMDRLFEASRFGAPCTEIRFEEAGVNLFAIGVRG